VLFSNSSGLVILLWNPCDNSRQYIPNLGPIQWCSSLMDCCHMRENVRAKKRGRDSIDWIKWTSGHTSTAESTFNPRTTSERIEPEVSSWEMRSVIYLSASRIFWRSPSVDDKRWYDFPRRQNGTRFKFLKPKLGGTKTP
jgi:hypothetical protein